MLKLIEIDKKDKWNNFIFNNEFNFYSFLQSWEWWEIQKWFKKLIIRYWIFENDIQIWAMQIIKNNAKRWAYFLIAHGPLISYKLVKNDKIEDIFKNIIEYIKKDAKKEKISFIRINSCFENKIENKNIFKRLGFIDSPMHEHAEDTFLLDLSKSEEELFKNIKKKDRYYISRAIKEGVEIKIWNDKEHIEKLIEMHYKHSKRDNWKNTYKAFDIKFIKNLYENFKDNISTISASYNNNIESILMTIRFWKTCVYYIAASDIKNTKFSPNYLCQWEAIKKAKTDGASIYNFWGISPDDNEKHPIAWVTKFKKKFWWYEYNLLHSQDLIISAKYYINYIIETIRRIKRWYYYKKAK